MDKRYFEANRKTTETNITLKLNLDGGKIDVKTTIGFLDHMLELFAKHGSFGLEVRAAGDTFIDFHHTVEDIGILMGKAFYETAGDKLGIKRYGFFLLPMDETLVESAVDFSGRTFFAYNVTFPSNKVGDFDTELVGEFWHAFAQNAKINLHIILRYGTNSHHIAEGIFKCVAKSLKQSLTITGTEILSTKGLLE